MTEDVSWLIQRLDGALIPAVPVPFRGGDLDSAAQRSYAGWMAGQPLRLPENSVAKLDLLALSPEHRSAIEAENAMTLSRSSVKSKTRRVKA